MNETQNQNQQKRYSFMELYRCVTPDGKPYIGVTVEGVLRNVKELRTVQVNGKDRSVLNAQMCLHNQGQRIGEMASAFYGQTIVPTESNDVIYANVSFWGKAAERLANYMAKHPDGRFTITLVGSLTIQNNDQYTNVELRASNFNIHPMPQATNGGQQPAAPAQAPAAPQAQKPAQPQAPAGWGQPQQAPAPAAPAQAPGYPQSQGPDFFDLSDEDGELPF